MKDKEKIDFSKDIKNLIKFSLMINIILLIILLIFNRDSSIIIGLLLGYIISIVNYRLTYLALNKAVTLSPGRASVYVSGQFILRYILLGLLTYVSYKNPSVDIIAFILGFMSFKIAIYIVNISKKGAKNGY